MSPIVTVRRLCLRFSAIGYGKAAVQVASRLQEVASACSNSEAERGDLKQVLPLGNGRLHPVGSRTLLMAILNVTPDSFSDGGSFLHVCVAQTYWQRR